MFKNYINTVLRGIWKYKVYSAINILGLAIGLTASLLILMYVRYELSFDRHHVNHERIHRISLHGSLAGSEVNANVTPYPMAATAKNEFTQVEDAVRVRRFFNETLVSKGDVRYQESEVFHADPSFFNIFTHNLLAGDAASALAEPNSIVIADSIARKYFGSEDALGQILRFNENRDYQVTGVMEDVPANSHFYPEILVSFTSDGDHDSQLWVSNNIHTYLLLQEQTSPAELEENLQSLVPKYVAPQIEQGIGSSFEEFVASGGYWAYGLMPLADIHLYSQLEGELEAPGSAAYVYTFQAVAVFILLLACINFMNLSTARSANRAREIGVRKVMGAYRSQLVLQFLTESLLISFLALLIALPLVAALLPVLNAVTDRQMEIATLLTLPSLAGLLAFTVIVGAISGSYPAFFLSRFHPQEVLKGALGRGGKNVWLRGGLVVFQFTISIGLISATLVVFDQLSYLRSKPLGFDKEQVLILHRATALGDQLDSFKNRLRLNPAVLGVSSSQHLPGDQGDQNAFQIEGRPQSEAHVLARFTVDYDFVETLGIELKEGRSFSEEFTGEHPGFIINEKAVASLQLSEPLQTTLMEPDGENSFDIGPVVGVVRDFHFQSLHQEIEPMVMRISEFARFVVLRIQAEDVQNTLEVVESTWSEMTNGQPLDYSFLDEDFDELHRGEQRMGEIFIGFSLLAIVIACLGLYGLASYTTEQRSKEIGVRKTLGATVADIVLLIAREFLPLVLIALLLAAPLAYLALNQWLELFAYRVEIGPTAFLLSGVTALIIAFLTVSYQSAMTALTNPSLTLRDE